MEEEQRLEKVRKRVRKNEKKLEEQAKKLSGNENKLYKQVLELNNTFLKTSYLSECKGAK
ncbi:hypothetical protein [Dolosigranulum pigrum]|uniref:hypothetical protein n=1 Tax=Dolosigranulum pigrum TaxID=29394 RepID=UPI001AD86F66|nr:hypothetical protein [Dolosigranulum pigrum]QTJ57817.1 hypothetical protein FE336_00685 [Dolosigranulum pigrum]